MKNAFFLAIPLVFVLAGCTDLPAGNKPIDNADPHQNDGGISQNINSGEEIQVVVTDPTEEVVVEDTTDVSSITDLTVDGIAYDATNKLFTISKAGTFTFTGEFNGNILVAAGDDDEVKIELKGFTIKSKVDSPIKCDNAGEFQLSIKKDTTNYIYDYRSTKTVDNDAQGNGAVTSSCDMEVSGKGTLYILGKYYNGIHCKDNLEIDPTVNNGSSLQIESYNNCLKGNDGVKIKSGNLVLISTNGNGIITENTDISSKGKQRGTIAISGGQVDIYSAKDAIDAAYNAEISASDVENPPVVNIYTSKYSTYSSSTVETSTSKMYLRLSNSVNTSSYYYAVEFLSNDYYTSWKKATSASSSYNYKYLSVDAPSNATSFKVCSFATSVSTMSEDNAYAKMSSYQTINQNYDTAKLSVSGTSIQVSGWTNYSSSTQGGGNQGGPGGGGPGQMEEGNTEKAEVSAKGIKANNEVNISAGKIFVKTYDDAIHANYGETLENGATGLGNVNISGGELKIYASDDGLHADNTLSVTGGTIQIDYSYEGVEGNIINISGGYTKVYSIDDGLNAAKKANLNPAINVSGGVVDVTVYGQDVDGIDSNGTFAQTGGYVITKGGNSQMSTGLDVDGTASINGGTFVAFGRTEKTPSKGTGITSYSLSGSYSSGNYKITFADSTEVNVTTKYSYSIIYVYSDTSTKITVTKI